MKKSIIATLLIVSLTGTIITGCGSSASVTTENSAETNSVEADSKKTDSSEKEPKAAESDSAEAADNETEISEEDLTNPETFGVLIPGDEGFEVFRSTSTSYSNLEDPNTIPDTPSKEIIYEYGTALRHEILKSYHDGTDADYRETYDLPGDTVYSYTSNNNDLIHSDIWYDRKELKDKDVLQDLESFRMHIESRIKQFSKDENNCQLINNDGDTLTYECKVNMMNDNGTTIDDLYRMTVDLHTKNLLELESITLSPFSNLYDYEIEKFSEIGTLDLQIPQEIIDTAEPSPYL